MFGVVACNGIHLVRARRRLVLHRRSDWLAADHAMKAEIGRSAIKRSTVRRATATPSRLRCCQTLRTCAVDFEVLCEDALNL